MEDPIRLSNDEAFAKTPVTGSANQQPLEAPEAVLEAPPPPSYVPFKPEDAAHVAWEDLANPEGGADSRAAFVESLRKVGFAFLSLPDSMMGASSSPTLRTIFVLFCVLYCFIIYLIKCKKINYIK